MTCLNNCGIIKQHIFIKHRKVCGKMCTQKFPLRVRFITCLNMCTCVGKGLAGSYAFTSFQIRNQIIYFLYGSRCNKKRLDYLDSLRSSKNAFQLVGCFLCNFFANSCEEIVEMFSNMFLIWDCFTILKYGRRRRQFCFFKSIKLRSFSYSLQSICGNVPFYVFLEDLLFYFDIV